MAEQKTDETKSNSARRAARPFTGPAGVAASTRPPILRPATTSTRPARGPFAPLGSRPALGRTAAGHPAAPSGVPSPSPVGIEAELPPATPELCGSVIVGVVPVSPEPPSPSAAAAESPRAGAADEARPPIREEIEAAAPSDDALSMADPTTIDPGMDALRAKEAFAESSDIWEPVPDLDAPSEHGMAADCSEPPLDEPTPGGGIDSQWVLPDGIAPLSGRADGPDALPLEPARASVVDADGDSSPAIPPAEDVFAASPDAGMVIVPEVAPTLPVMEEARSAPTNMEPVSDALMAEVASLSASVAVAPERSAWPDQLLAEYAPDVASPSALNPGAVSGVNARAQPAASGSEFRIAAALDRLAERVRCGEIPVSFVAPEANDAAVLASLLAALLGGSSRR